MGKEFLHDLNIHGAGQIQFKNTAGTNAGKIDQNGNDLVLSNSVGDIIIGNGSDDVFIGDGTNTVDIRFEQNMAIFADSSSTRTLTLGGANTSLVLESPTINGSLSLGATTINQNLIFTTANGHIVFDHETTDTGEYGTEVALLKIDVAGTEKTILSRVSKQGALALGTDDTVAITAGDTKSVIKANHNYAAENIVFASEGGFLAYGFPNNDTTWSNRNVFEFRAYDSTAANNGLYIGDGSRTQFIDLSRNLKNIGTITASGKISGGEIEGTSLDINGTSDVSGNAVFHGKSSFGATTDNLYNVHVKGTGWAGSGLAIEATTTNGAVLTLFNTDRQFAIASRGNTLDFRDITDSDTRRFFVNSAGHLQPGADSSYNLGTDSNRWLNVYADTLRTVTLNAVNSSTNGKAATFDDGTSALHIVPNLGSGGYTGLSSAGDIGLIFTIDNDNTTDSTSNGLLIAPHTQTSGGLKILENGRVGIGTGSPGANLDIQGTSAQSLRVKSDDSASIIIDSDGDNSGTSGSYLHYRDTGATKWTLYKETNNDFYLHNAAASTYPIHAKANGHILLMEDGNNLGIGNTGNPSAKLTIAQSADANGLKILGYDDKSTSGVTLNLDASGHARLSQTTDGSSGYLFLQAENYLQLIAGTFTYTQNPFRIYDNTQLQFGNSADYKISHISNSDILVIHTDDNKGITIDNAGNTTFSDNVTIEGNLNITGDIDSYNVNNLDVVDKLITVGKGQTEANSNGSGILVDGSNASLLWDETNNTWDFNKSLSIVGGITASDTVYISSKLEHTGDSDTFLNFSDNTITLTAGGSSTTFAGNGNATFPGQITIGADTSGSDLIVYGNDTGERMFWDASESNLTINHDTDDSGLEIYTVGSAQPTTHQVKIGRDNGQYLGIRVDDGRSYFVHRQDESGGGDNHHQSNQIWTDGGGTHTWNWDIANSSGGSPSNKMQLNSSGALSLAGSITAGGQITSGRLNITDAGVPIKFTESGNTGTGKYWRQVLDAGDIRFDVDTTSTNGDGSFSSYNALIQLNADGHTDINGALDVAGNIDANGNLDVAGNIVVAGTVDGVDIQTLNTTASAALPKAGGTMTGPLTISDSLSNPNPLLTLYNNTNGGGSTILFGDQSPQSQTGKITFYHADGSSQGGNASFYMTSTEADLVLVLGDGTNTGRIAVGSKGDTAEVDYGFLGDVNTGMVRTSADNVSLVAGGVRGVGVGSTAVSLKYAGSTKIATTNTGIDVTGNGVFSGNVTTSGNVSVGNDLYVPNEIYHTGDTDTSIRFPAEDQFRVVTGDGNRLQVENTKILVGDDVNMNFDGISGGSVDGNNVQQSGNSGTVVYGGFLNPASEANMVHIPHIINDLAGFNRWSNATITTSGFYKSRSGSSGSYTYSNEVQANDSGWANAFDAHSSTAGSWYSDNGSDGIYQHGTDTPGVVELEWTNEATYSLYAGIVFGSNSFTPTYVKIEAYRAGAWQTLCEITDNTDQVILRQVSGNQGTNAATRRLKYTLGGSVNNSYFRIHSLYMVNYAAGNNNLNNTGTDTTRGVNFLERYKDGYLHGHFRPGADDTYDLGSSSYKWKNSYFDGVVYADRVQSEGAFPQYNIIDTPNGGGSSRTMQLGMSGSSLYFKKSDATGSVIFRNTNNTNLMTIGLADTGQVTVLNELEAGSLDINGNADISGTSTFGGDVTIGKASASASSGSKSLTFKGVDDNGTEIVAAKILTVDSANNPQGQDLNIQVAADNSTLFTAMQVNSSGFIGIGVTGGSINNHLHLADNYSLGLGASSDLKLIHNATDSLIENSTGNLYITNKADNKDIIFRSDDGSGGFTPYFRLDGSDERLIIEASNGMLFYDNVKAKFGNGSDLQIYHDGSNSYIENTGTGDLIFKGNTNVKVNGDGTGTVLFQVDASGDIGLQVDTGSGNYIFGDYGGVADGNYVNSSAGGAFSFRNGSSSGDIKFEIDAANNFTRHKDNVIANFGDGNDLQIYHAASGIAGNSIIDNATGDILIRNTADNRSISILTDNGSGSTTTYVKANGLSGAAELYHYGSKKFETTSTGIAVTGVVANRDIPMVIHGSFDDTTSSTSNLIIPLAGSITETTVSGGYAPHFFTIPYACVLKRVIMKTVAGSQSSSFTTELKAYKNGSVTSDSSSGELTHSNSSITWNPTAHNDITYAAGDKFSLVYQKSATSKYWQDVAITIVFTLTNYDI